jgi:hypothetical protein
MGLTNACAEFADVETNVVSAISLNTAYHQRPIAHPRAMVFREGGQDDATHTLAAWRSALHCFDSHAIGCNSLLNVRLSRETGVMSSPEGGRGPDGVPNHFSKQLQL